MSFPEANLACAVIAQTVKDVIRSKVPDSSDIDFLTGKSDIGLFWFQVAGLEPFSKASLSQYRRFSC